MINITVYRDTSLTKRWVAHYGQMVRYGPTKAAALAAMNEGLYKQANYFECIQYITLNDGSLFVLSYQDGWIIQRVTFECDGCGKVRATHLLTQDYTPGQAYELFTEYAADYNSSL